MGGVVQQGGAGQSPWEQGQSGAPQGRLYGQQLTRTPEPAPLEQHPGIVRGAFADLGWIVRSRQGRVLGAAAIGLGIGFALDIAILIGFLLLAAVIGAIVNSVSLAILGVIALFAAYIGALAVGAAATLTNSAALIMPAVDAVDPRASVSVPRSGPARWGGAFAAALVAQAIVGAGFVLCIVPGMVAYLFLLTTPFERVVDPGLRLGEAIKRSAKRFQSAPGGLFLLVLSSAAVAAVPALPGWVLSLIADATRPRVYDPYYGYSYRSSSLTAWHVVAGVLLLVGVILGIVLFQVLISLGVRRLLIAQSVVPDGSGGAGWAVAPPPFGQSPSGGDPVAVSPPAATPLPWSSPAPAPQPPPAAPVLPAVRPQPPASASPPASFAPQPPTPVLPAAAAAQWPAPGEEGDLFGGETVRRPGRSAGSGWQVTVPGAPPSDLGRLTLIGRHPEPTADDTARYGTSAIRLVAVVDTERLVSKTHLALGVDADGVWAVDRGSTNGTVLVTASGRLAMTPGEVVRIAEATTFDIGDVLVTVTKTPA